MAMMALPENRYNPTLLVEAAQIAVEKQDWLTALTDSQTAERHWARLPAGPSGASVPALSSAARLALATLVLGLAAGTIGSRTLRQRAGGSQRRGRRGG